MGTSRLPESGSLSRNHSFWLTLLTTWQERKGSPDGGSPSLWGLAPGVSRLGDEPRKVLEDLQANRGWASEMPRQRPEAAITWGCRRWYLRCCSAPSSRKKTHDGQMFVSRRQEDPAS